METIIEKLSKKCFNNIDLETELFRLYGTEHEFGNEPSNLAFGTVQRMVMETERATRYGHTPRGPRWYLDGYHFEMSTTGCVSIRGATSAYFAEVDYIRENLQGRLIAHDVYGEMVEDPLDLRTIIVDDNGEAYGFHKNFLSRLDPTKPDVFMPLASLLAVHYIYGAGWIDSSGIFHRSQKAHTIESEVSFTTTEARGMVNTRREPHGTIGRMHVPHTDPALNRHEFAVSLGVISGFLQLMEAGVDVSDIVLENSVRAAREVGGDLPENKTLVTLENGKQVYAHSVLRRAAELILDNQERVEFTDEEVRLARLVVKDMDDFDDDPFKLLGRITAISKRGAYLKDRDDGVDLKVINQKLKNWHSLNYDDEQSENPLVLLQRKSETYDPDPLDSKALDADLVQSPYVGGSDRDYARAVLIENIMRGTSVFPPEVVIDWGTFSIPYDMTDGFEDLSDNPKKFEELRSMPDGTMTKIAIYVSVERAYEYHIQHGGNEHLDVMSGV